jgi:hypothetical protein
LSEVIVKGEGLPQAQLFHQSEAGAISETQIHVGVFLKESPGGKSLVFRYASYRDNAAVHKGISENHRGLVGNPVKYDG